MKHKITLRKIIITAVYVTLLGHFLFSNIFFTLGPAVLVHNAPEPACVPSKTKSCDINCPVWVGSKLDTEPKAPRIEQNPLRNLDSVHTKGFPLAWKWENPQQLNDCGGPNVQEPPMAMTVNSIYITIVTLLYVFYLQRTPTKRNTRPKSSRSKN